MQAESTVKKVHSLIDKVYHPTNLKLAWKKVKLNRGVEESIKLVSKILQM